MHEAFFFFFEHEATLCTSYSQGNGGVRGNIKNSSRLSKNSSLLTRTLVATVSPCCWWGCVTCPWSAGRKMSENHWLILNFSLIIVMGLNNSLAHKFCLLWWHVQENTHKHNYFNNNVSGCPAVCTGVSKSEKVNQWVFVIPSKKRLIYLGEKNGNVKKYISKLRWK